MPPHPVHDAAYRGDLAAVAQWLTSEPQLLHEENAFGMTPLLCAADAGQVRARLHTYT
jgi:ankyrin repeat protein